MALARSRRSGPNGEVQLTPTPIDSRGVGESPTKNSLKPAIRENPAVPLVGPQVVCVPPGTSWNALPVVFSVTGTQVAITSVRIGRVMLNSEPTSTNAEGLNPTLFKLE